MWGRIERFVQPILSGTRAAALVVLLLPSGSRAVAGQQTEPLQVGDRIRITSPDGQRSTTGRIVLLTPYSLQLRAAAGLAYSIDRGEIGTLERSLCRRCWAKSGALIGAGLGLAAGIFLAQHVNCDEGCLQGFDVLYVTGIGTGAGALLGLAFGALISPERWESVPLERALAGSELRVSPTRDGALALTARLHV